MKIVLVASTAPLTCVYCHDVLGGGSLVGCKKCGTCYHLECARLSGACGLIGCDGALETASGASRPADDARLALNMW